MIMKVIEKKLIIASTFSHGNLIDSMDDWLEHGNNAEL